MANTDFLTKYDITDELKNTLLEIIAIVKSCHGEPITKSSLKESLSRAYHKYFDEARKLAIRSGSIYVTLKGYIHSNYVDTMSIDDRTLHISWCLGLHETSSRQLLMDEQILLDTPDLARRVLSESTLSPEKKTELLQNMASKTMQMQNTLTQLSNTYSMVEEGMRELLGSTQKKVRPKTLGKGLESLESLKTFDEEKPTCGECLSPRIIIEKPKMKYGKRHVKCLDCDHEYFIK